MQKICFGCLLLLILPCWLMADWRMELYVANRHANGADSLYNWASFGELQNAQEGYDTHDLSYLFPPMGNRYVVPYFRHTDWGANSGNFSVDMRSAVPATKIWESTVRSQNPYNNTFTLYWSCSLGEMPAYYSPKLIFGQNQIDMRAQHSFSYTSGTSLTNFRIQLDFDPQMPYISQALGEILFSDNLPRQIALNDYFAVGSGSLTYSFLPNENIIQELLTQDNASLWQLKPRAGWRGTAAITLSAHNGNRSVSQQVLVSRDSTNTAPELMQALPGLEIQQNGEYLWDWQDFVRDIDDDEILLSAENTSELFLDADNSAKTLYIKPIEGFKGDASIALSWGDAVATSEIYHLQISVLPSTPKAPQNLRLYVSGDSLLCTWDAVDSDIQDLALWGIVYDVYSSDTPDFDADARRLAQDLAENQLWLPLPQRRAFFRIIAKNP